MEPSRSTGWYWVKWDKAWKQWVPAIYNASTQAWFNPRTWLEPSRVPEVIGPYIPQPEDKVPGILE